MKKVLSDSEMTPGALSAIVNFHPKAVEEVINAIKDNEWVIVGMSQNPHVKKARKYLETRNIKYRYIEHGSYFSQWQIRLAIKLWSGWPTFPQVFHKGKLVGGASDLFKYLP